MYFILLAMEKQSFIDGLRRTHEPADLTSFSQHLFQTVPLKVVLLAALWTSVNL